MKKLEFAKKSWGIISSIVTILFLVFLGLGTISDNIPKVSILYENVFSEKVNFSMNSEKNKFFMIKSTLNGNYKIEGDFIKIHTKDFVIQYKKKDNQPFVQKIGFVRMGIAKYTRPPTKRWYAEIFSQEVQINKTIIANGSLILPEKEFIIPRAKIDDLSKYWIVLEIGSLSDNNKNMSTVYVHSSKDIFKDNNL